MKVYVTKHTFTDGKIRSMKVESDGSGYVWVRGGSWKTWIRLGKDAHETEEAALARVETERLKKIASLKKQIAKLEAMKFTIVGDDEE